MTQVVLDANAIASGMVRFRTSRTAPVAVLHAWVDGAFSVVTSKHIMEELQRTLAKPYFVRGVETEARELIVDALAKQATHVTPSPRVSGVASHPQGDAILGTAVSGNADYLVTGDRDLQRLRTFECVAIVSPAEFVHILDLEPTTR